MCRVRICPWRHPILWIKQELHLRRMRKITRAADLEEIDLDDFPDGYTVLNADTMKPEQPE